MLETEYSFSPIGFLHSPLKNRGEAPGKTVKAPPTPLHGEVFREEAGSPVILSRSEESLVGSHADSSLWLRMTGEELDGEKNLPVKASNAWLEVHSTVAEGLEGIAVGDEINFASDTPRNGQKK